MYPFCLIRDGRPVRDVAFEEVRREASYITPVPKGRQTMTVTMLIVNTIKVTMTTWAEPVV